jgi:3-isopropylmalate/(R)-2-methylmalate dehydratase small subunit
VPPAQAGLPKGHVPLHGPDDPIVSPYRILIGGRNFGCGSSREHAPIALDAAGFQAIVAEFYARIFYRNTVNGGYLVPFETGDRLCERICTGDLLEIDVEKGILYNRTTSEQFALRPLGEVAPILEEGGLFPYARKVGMLPAGV